MFLLYPEACIEREHTSRILMVCYMRCSGNAISLHEKKARTPISRSAAVPMLIPLMFKKLTLNGTSSNNARAPARTRVRWNDIVPDELKRDKGNQ